MRSYTEQGHLDYILEQNAVHYARNLGLQTESDVQNDTRHRRGGSKSADAADQQYWKGVRKRNASGSMKLSFINSKSEIAKRSRGGEPQSVDQEVAARKAWAAEYDNMSEEARMDFRRLNLPPALLSDNSNAIPTSSSSPGLLDVLAGELLLETGPRDGAWRGRKVFPVDVSDDTWPVAVEEYLKVLTSLSHSASRVPGQAKLGHEVRSSLRDQLIVVGPSSEVPIGKVVCDVPCYEKHPGLCVTRDALVFDDALMVASALRAFVKDTPSGRFLLLTFEPRLGPASQRYLCMGTSRGRDPPLAVFGSCLASPLADGRKLVSLSLNPRSHGDEFEFTTCYALAKECLRGDVLRIEVSECRYTNRDTISAVLL